MKPHKHAELIKAWADGAEIEFYSEQSKQWIFTAFPHWIPDEKFRIKPQPKPDVEYKTHIRWDKGWQLVDTTSTKSANLKLTLDSETGELKSAEVL